MCCDSMTCQSLWNILLCFLKKERKKFRRNSTAEKCARWRKMSETKQQWKNSRIKNTLPSLTCSKHKPLLNYYSFIYLTLMISHKWASFSWLHSLKWPLDVQSNWPKGLFSNYKHLFWFFFLTPTWLCFWWGRPQSQEDSYQHSTSWVWFSHR